MADERISLPSTGAGLTRFYDVSGASRFQLSPHSVVVFSVLVIFAVILLHVLRIG